MEIFILIGLIITSECNHIVEFSSEVTTNVRVVRLDPPCLKIEWDGIWVTWHSSWEGSQEELPPFIITSADFAAAINGPSTQWRCYQIINSNRFIIPCLEPEIIDINFFAAHEFIDGNSQWIFTTTHKVSDNSYPACICDLDGDGDVDLKDYYLWTNTISNLG